MFDHAGEYRCQRSVGRVERAAASHGSPTRSGTMHTKWGSMAAGRCPPGTSITMPLDREAAASQDSTSSSMTMRSTLEVESSDWGKIEGKAAAGESSTKSNTESAAHGNVEDNSATRMNLRAMHCEDLLARRQLPPQANGSETLADEEYELNLPQMASPVIAPQKRWCSSPLETRLPAS
jgi:hypothetical protein